MNRRSFLRAAALTPVAAAAAATGIPASPAAPVVMRGVTSGRLFVTALGAGIIPMREAWRMLGVTEEQISGYERSVLVTRETGVLIPRNHKNWHE